MAKVARRAGSTAISDLGGCLWFSRPFVNGTEGRERPRIGSINPCQFYCTGWSARRPDHRGSGYDAATCWAISRGCLSITSFTCPRSRIGTVARTEGTRPPIGRCPYGAASVHDAGSSRCSVAPAIHPSAIGTGAIWCARQLTEGRVAGDARRSRAAGTPSEGT